MPGALRRIAVGARYRMRQPSVTRLEQHQRRAGRHSERSGDNATEVFRGAIQAIPKGQIEAAKACGMSRLQVFFRIVLPQAWRIAIPGLGNLFQVLLKDTSLISVVGLEEIMRKSQIAISNTKEPFTFYFAAAMIYLTITIIVMLAQRRAEQWASRGMRGRDQ